jgi:hypothetical protein
MNTYKPKIAKRFPSKKVLNLNSLAKVIGGGYRRKFLPFHVVKQSQT